MKKRGMIEFEFHWVFILIAGAVIFFFFMNVVNKQKEYSDVKTSGTITTNLESILTGAQISTGTVNIIDIPKIDIKFECDKYSIGLISRQTRGNVIFSPGLLKGKELITWTLDWGLPYRITNFLYLTDPQLRYIIVYEDSNYQEVASRIHRELPKEMNKDDDLIDENQIQSVQNKNNYKVKFIFVGSPTWNPIEFPTKLQSMLDKDLTAIKIEYENAPALIPPKGTIKFMQKRLSGWHTLGETYYLKEESLFGAIFAEDVEMYNCVMGKAFKKASLVSNVYYERSRDLSADYITNNVPCSSPHYDVLDILKNMEDDSMVQSNGFPTDETKINDIDRYSDEIKAQNQRAELFSCALIY
ncbi:MAG: hypothetical protein U9O94_03990 [Nanoarchaeota archaeon]|nr:hypothetical protein [Nanoarchaeota archaeon]